MFASKVEPPKVEHLEIPNLEVYLGSNHKFKTKVKQLLGKRTSLFVYIIFVKEKWFYIICDYIFNFWKISTLSSLTLFRTPISE
jgi:hypothetical protein